MAPTDLTELSEGLLRDLEALYSDPEVPPCRVCGGGLSTQGRAQGEILWACGSQTREMSPGLSKAERKQWWDHYDQSRWFQHRLGDGRVLDLIQAYRLLTAEIAHSELALVAMPSGVEIRTCGCGRAPDGAPGTGMGCSAECMNVEAIEFAGVAGVDLVPGQGDTSAAPLRVYLRHPQLGQPLCDFDVEQASVVAAALCAAVSRAKIEEAHRG